VRRLDHRRSVAVRQRQLVAIDLPVGQITLWGDATHASQQTRQRNKPTTPRNDAMARARD
jgi:hypothetical protein